MRRGMVRSYDHGIDHDEIWAAYPTDIAGEFLLYNTAQGEHCRNAFLAVQGKCETEETLEFVDYVGATPFKIDTWRDHQEYDPDQVASTYGGQLLHG